VDFMQGRKLVAVIIVAGIVLSLCSVFAQIPPVSGIYHIRSGTYTECCGFAGIPTVYSLPNQNQTFVKVLIDPQGTTATMTFLAEDQRTVFTTVPCLPDGAIDFSFPYGFVSGNSIAFHVDPGPPPYSKYWNYTASNSVSGLCIDGTVGTLQAGCADTPTQFSHSNVVAVLVPAPRLTLLGFSGDHGAQLFIQGNAGETNVIETSADLSNWIPISTNVMDYSLCPICPYFIFEDAESTNLTHRFYRVYKLF
jgi:hypothetical protein